MATGIGETLRTARRRQGVALADAAAETRVREAYLAALEEEDFAALGGNVYVKGFLRSYARFLRLDPEPLVDTFRQQHERTAEDLAPLAQQPVAAMTAERGPGLALVGGAAVVIIVVLALIGMRGPGEQPSSVDLAGAPPPVTESEIDAGAAQPDDRSSDAAGGGQDATEAPGTAVSASEGQPFEELVVTMEISDGASWTRVTVDGQIQQEGEQDAGQTATYNPDQEIQLRIGNAAAVRVTVNGQDQGVLGSSGQVVEFTCVIGKVGCQSEVVA